MKILQALFFPPEQPGGVSSMVPYIHDQFIRLGWDMDLFYLPKRIRGKGSGEVHFTTMDWQRYAGHEIVDKYMQTYKDYVWWIQQRLSGDFDLIHAHHPIAAIAMRACFPDTPIVATVHSSFETELTLNGKIAADGPEYRFLTGLYGELEHCADQVITASRSFRDYIGAHMSHPERIEVIPNGFDQERFRPMDHENAVPQIVTLCRLVPAKGLDVMLRACAQLKRKGYPFVLHIIGDGPIRKQLEQMAVDLDLYEETIFYGYVLHPEQFMPFFDIFALPSRAEAFGSVFAEAALCWMALIGTNVGGIAEQIEHGKNGLLVPPDDVDALCAALEQVISDPAYRYELARAAWEKAKQEYSLERVVRHLQRLYEDLLSSARQGKASV